VLSPKIEKAASRWAKYFRMGELGLQCSGIGNHVKCQGLLVNNESYSSCSVLWCVVFVAGKNVVKVAWWLRRRCQQHDLGNGQFTLPF